MPSAGHALLMQVGHGLCIPVCNRTGTQVVAFVRTQASEAEKIKQKRLTEERGE